MVLENTKINIHTLSKWYDNISKLATTMWHGLQARHCDHLTVIFAWYSHISVQYDFQMHIPFHVSSCYKLWPKYFLHGTHLLWLFEVMFTNKLWNTGGAWALTQIIVWRGGGGGGGGGAGGAWALTQIIVWRNMLKCAFTNAGIRVETTCAIHVITTWHIGINVSIAQSCISAIE